MRNIIVAGLTVLGSMHLMSCQQASSKPNLTSQEAPAKTIEAKPPVNKTVTINEKTKAHTTSQEAPTTDFPFDVELKDVTGKVHNSSDIFKKNGKPTVLMFWLTTCGPCHMKLNAIKPLYPQWKEEADFNVYAISGDYERNYEKFVKQTKSKNWEWETYNDVNRGFREILPGKLNGYPQTFIFDKDGKLVYQDKRYRPGDEHKLFKKIKEISEG